MFSCQRIDTIQNARKADFKPHRFGILWEIPAPLIKSKVPHIVPLPVCATRVVRAALQASEADNPFPFPKLRKWRAGDGDGGPISQNLIRSAMGNVVAPHDVRRVFATEAERGFSFSAVPSGDSRAKAFTLAEIKRILDHAEGRSGDVTAERYALGDGQHFKWRLMAEWQKWVMSAAAAQADGSGLPLLLLPLDERIEDAVSAR